MNPDKPHGVDTEAFLSRPIEIGKTEASLIAFFETVFKNNPLYQSGNIDLDTRNIKDLTRDVLRSNNPNDHLFIIKDVHGNIIATSRLQINGETAYISQQGVEKKYRQKGISRLLTDQNIEQARSAGCENVRCDVYSVNPVALVAKLRDGFEVDKVEIYGEDETGTLVGKFDLKKDLLPTSSTKIFQEQLTYALTDLRSLEEKFREGWKGIQAVKSGEVESEDPKNWVMILQK